MEPSISAVLGYVFREGKVLLIHRSVEPNCGLYTAPGGKIGPEESPEEAVQRELFEESSLRVTETRWVGCVIEVLPEHPGWVHHIYRCRADSGSVHPVCAEGTLGWFAVEDLIGGGLPVPEGDRIFNPWIVRCSAEPFRVRFEYGADGGLLGWERES